MRVGEIGASIILSGGMRFANIIFGVLVTVLLAQYLGAKGYGIYAYSYVIASVISVIIQMGLPRLAMRETAINATKGDWARMQRFWQWCTRISLALSGGICAVAALLILGFANQFDQTKILTLGIGAILIPFMILGALPGAVLRGLGFTIVGLLPELIIRQFIFIIFLLIFSTSALVLTPPRAMALNVVSAALAFAFGAWLLWRHLPEPAKAATPAPHTDPNWRRAALAMGLTASMNQINNYADVIILGMLRTSDEVGSYRVAYQASMLITFGLQAAILAITPRLARAAGSDDSELQRLALIGARVSTVVALPIALTYLVFGKEIIGFFFGYDFENAYIPLVLLSVSQLANAYFGTIGIFLQMVGRERVTANTMMVAAFANICLNLILIPFYGMNGAAFATLATVFAWKAYLWRYTLRHFGIDSSAALSPLRRLWYKSYK